MKNATFRQMQLKNAKSSVKDAKLATLKEINKNEEMNKET